MTHGWKSCQPECDSFSLRSTFAAACVRKSLEKSGQSKIAQLLCCLLLQLCVGKWTQWYAFGWLGQHFGQCRVSESFFHHRQGIVEPTMERAEAHAVRRQAQGTRTDALDRLHRVDHLQNREVFRRFHQR